MKRLALVPLLFAAFALCANTHVREIGPEQAKNVVLAVAHHDHIDVDDRTIVLNSMDTRNEAGFIPGYYSFSVIQESDSSASADQTIRMYIVSKRTADTWELNLCTHYSFPELARLQHTLMQQTGATPEDERNMSKAIGCGAPEKAQSASSQR
jgi:hypothetical protein